MTGAIILFSALACFASAYPAIEEPIYNRGDAIFLKQGDLPTTTAGADVCPNKPYSCSDCKTARVCLPQAGNQWKFRMNIPCPESRPFCEFATGTCVETPDPTCGKQDDFICVENGYMPDNTDCSKYHVCKNYAVNTFQCVNKTYDASIQDCVGTSAPCSPFDCRGQSGRKVPHQKFDTYFAYCMGDTASLVDKCPGAYVLNATSQACEPPCKFNGAVASNEGCTKYFTCTMVVYKKDVVIPTLTAQTCPKGMAFDPVHLVCTTSVENIPNCQV